MYSTNNVHTDNRINCSPYLQRLSFLCTTRRSDKLYSCLCCKNIHCYSSPICSIQEGKFRHFVTPSPQKIYPQSMSQNSLGYVAHNCCVSEKDLTRETKYMTLWLKRTEIWMFFGFFFYFFQLCMKYKELQPNSYGHWGIKRTSSMFDWLSIWKMFMKQLWKCRYVPRYIHISRQCISYLV